MNLFVHKIVVTVVSTDNNAASVGATIEGALDARSGVYASSADPVEGSAVASVPDVPFGGQPDTLAEIDAYDKWMNDHVVPLLIGGAR